MHRLSMTLGALVASAALLQGSSCSRASKALLQGIDRDLRMQEACAGFLADQESGTWQGSTTTGALVGDDPDAYRRLLTTLAGWPRGGDPPWAKIMDQLAEVAKDYPDEWNALLASADAKLRTPLEDGLRDWKLFRGHAEELVNQLSSSNTLSALRKCAESKLGSASESYCGFDAIDNELRRLNDLSRNFDEDASKLRKRGEEIIAGLNDVVAMGETLGGAARSDFAFLLAEVVAFAGMLRDMGRLAGDARRALRSEAPLRELSRLVVAANSDWVADVAIYWLQRGVHRLEEQLERLDEHTYGLTTVFYGASLKTTAAEQGVCALTTGVYSALLEAGLSPGAFGSRVCEELSEERAEADVAARSELLTLVYLSILGAEGALECKELERKSEGLLDLTGYEVPTDAAPPADPRFTTLGGDTLSLATADWQMRVKLAENHLSATPNANEKETFSVDALPSLDRASTDVRAPLLLASRSRAVVAGAQPSLREEHVEYQHTMRDGLGLARGGLRSLDQERTVCMWTHESDVPTDHWWGASIPACAPIVEMWRREGLCMEECGCCCQGPGVPGTDGGDSDTTSTSSSTSDTGDSDPDGDEGGKDTGPPPEAPHEFYDVDIRQSYRLKLFLVLDHSGSMGVSVEPGGPARWRQAQSLARGIVGRLSKKGDGSWRGLKLDVGVIAYEGEIYDEVKDGDGECHHKFPIELDVGDDFKKVRAEILRYDAPDPRAFTPTHAGLRRAVDHLGEGGARTMSRIVLITDARNNCPKTDPAHQRVYDELKSARVKGIKTYVASFDVRPAKEDYMDARDAARQRSLQQMAKSGGAPLKALDASTVEETANKVVDSLADEIMDGLCKIDISSHRRRRTDEFVSVDLKRSHDFGLTEGDDVLWLKGDACRQLMADGVIKVWFRRRH